MRSDFSKTLAAKGIGEAGSYLLNDNGHINQRTQNYLGLTVQRKKDTSQEAFVGPGSYQNKASDFERKNNVSGPIISAPTNSQSPRMRAAAVNPSLLKINAPSIPSKFLTPIIDTSRSDT